MKTVQLRVLSQLTDSFEQTDVVVAHIQTVTEHRVAGHHILCTIRLKGTDRELLVMNYKEEIELFLEFAHLEWNKLPHEFWQRLGQIVTTERKEKSWA
jgi:hypothetical protein